MTTRVRAILGYSALTVTREDEQNTIYSQESGKSREKPIQRCKAETDSGFSGFSAMGSGFLLLSGFLFRFLSVSLFCPGFSSLSLYIWKGSLLMNTSEIMSAKGVKFWLTKENAERYLDEFRSGDEYEFCKELFFSLWDGEETEYQKTEGIESEIDREEEEETCQECVYSMMEALEVFSLAICRISPLAV